MKTLRASGLQSLFDIAIQSTGAVTNVFEISMANNKSITDDLIVGESILIPDKSRISDNKTLKYLTDRNIFPATAITLEQQQIENSGIGAMRIESTFIVG